MPRRLVVICLLALGLIAPAAAGAKPPAATIDAPEVRTVRILDVRPAGGVLPNEGRVLVRVIVRHAPLRAPASGVRSVGTVTAIVTRFTGDRNYAIGGGTASRALPIAEHGLDVAYLIVLSADQSRKARVAARQGVLHIVVTASQRASAKSRAPASNGGFDQRDITLAAAAPNQTSSVPPLLANGSARVAVDVDRKGDAVVLTADVPVGGGRWLHIDTGGTPEHGLVPAGGGDGALIGSAILTDASGAEIARGRIEQGQVLFRVSPTGRQRGTLTWGVLTLGAVAVEPGRIVLSPPTTAR